MITDMADAISQLRAVMQFLDDEGYCWAAADVNQGLEKLIASPAAIFAEEPSDAIHCPQTV